MSCLIRLRGPALTLFNTLWRLFHVNSTLLEGCFSHRLCACADIFLKLPCRNLGLEHLMDFLESSVTGLGHVKESEYEEDQV